MKSIIFTRYGKADVLKCADIARPTPADDEILVRVHATTVTPVDAMFRAGNPFVTRLYMGLLRPKHHILGTELAGRVEAVGKNASRFRPGDEIFAATADGTGAHAEYVVLPDNGAQIIKPANMNFEQAATLCNGGLTALPFLRDSAKIQPGQKVLINGASGSIGTIAVQLAKHFGAHVTAVCSGANTELVKSLGADEVIDYTQQDFTRGGQTYDIIFDTVGKSSFGKCKPVLSEKGYYLSTVLNCSNAMQMLLTIRSNGKRAILSATGLRPAKDQIKDMEFLRDLIEAGKLVTVIDRSYPFSEIARAHDFVEKGHKRGNVVITVNPPLAALTAA